MKYVAVFLAGIAFLPVAGVGVILAQPATTWSGAPTIDISQPALAVMAAGVGPDGKMASILVDSHGHVICSTEQIK